MERKLSIYAFQSSFHETIENYQLSTCISILISRLFYDLSQKFKMKISILRKIAKIYNFSLKLIIKTEIISISVRINYLKRFSSKPSVKG